MDNKPWFLRLIKQINTKVRNNLKNNLKRYDVTDAQLEVIMYLKFNKEKGVNQRDVENELRLSNPTVVSIIDRLEEKGLVSRIPCEADRRQKNLLITENGEKLCDALYDDFCNMESAVLDCISENEQAVLKGLLNLLLKNVEKIKEEA